MIRRYKVPKSEQYGDERITYYPRTISLKGKDWFDPDEDDE